MLTHAPVLTPLELKAAIILDPLVVSPDITVMDAIAQMSGVRSQCSATKTLDSQREQLTLEVRSSCVLIVEQQQLVGILTERDVVRLSAEQKPLEHLTLRQVMTSAVVTLRQSAFTDLLFAVNLLQQCHIRHLPIVDDQGGLVGVVTYESLRRLSRPIDLLRLRLVAEVMTSQVVCATSDCSILAIAQRMATHKISSVMIVERQGSPAQPVQIPIGILTERDLVQFQALGLNLEHCTAATVMSTPIFTITPDESLWAVQQIMEQRFIRRLAVTGTQGELLGIITQTNLLQALNPLELYNLAEVLEAKVERLEAEKVALLESRTVELEQQVAARTAALKAKAEQETLLAALATQIRSSLSLQTILDTTVQQVRQVLGCQRVIIWQVDAAWQTVVVAESTDAPRSLLGEKVHDLCLKRELVDNYRQGYIRVVPDIHTTAMADCHRDMLVHLQIRAKLLVPLLCGDQLWGLLSATESHDAREWQPEEIELLQALSVQLAIALKQATTYQHLQEELLERQQVEARLRESEQRYATLAAAVPVGIFCTDVLGNCTYVNDRWCQISGLTPDQAAGKGWLQGLHPDDRSMIIEKWQQLTPKDHPFQLEYRFQRPDGGVSWVYGQSVAERNANGLVIGYVGTITDISDRKRSEEALQKSEAHQRALISAIPDLIMRVNRAGIYLEFVATPNFHVVGSIPDMVGTHVGKTLPPDMVAKRMGFIQLALETNSIQLYEQDLSINGKTQIEEVRVVPYSEDEVLLLVRDISDRKQAEFALKQSEAKSRAVLAAIPDLMFRVGANGVYRGFVTHRRTFDLLSQELDPTGQSMTDLLPAELAERQFYYLQQALKTGELQIYEQKLQVGDRLQEEEIRVVKSSDDEVLFMIRDISDRKQAERQLHQLNQDLEAKIEERTAELKERQVELRRLSERLALALKSGAIGCWEWDIVQNTRFWDQRMYELYGLTQSSDSCLDHELWLARLHPDDRLSTETLIHRTLAGEAEYNTEFRVVHPDGRICFIKAYGVVVRDAQGCPKSVIGVNFDITDRKQSEAQLQQTNEELARATRLKDEFLANMSHELRTPLNAILGMAEGLQEQVFGAINAQQLKALQTIEHSGSHLLELINDILDVAKIEAGQMELHCLPIAVAPLCQSSLSFVKQQALRKSIQLEIKLPLNLPDLLIDERRIRQVLINLLNNAVKFTPDGGQITLEVSPDIFSCPRKTGPSTQDCLQIAIIDTGIGIAPDDIGKLFQPFVQIDSALNRQYQGTGLGLALVKRIVELHGGQVGLTSEVAVGSCFTIMLPCTAPIPHRLEAPPASANSTVSGQPQQELSPLILLAEDNDANIITVSSYLKAKGYRVVLARNGQDAIALAQAQVPHLILMDIQMPGMDGLNAMQHIRHDPRLVNVPIVALTALALTGDRERCLAAGANDYLTKPIQLKQLITTIQHLLAPQAVA